MGIDARMLIKTRTKLTKKEINKLSFRISEAFYSNTFVIWKESSYGEKQHALSLIKKYEQDGPDVIPGKEEYFIEVNLMGRYYGKGYERGQLPIYIMVAEWIENNIPNCEVWYGGDSSGICIEKFGKNERKKLFKHFANNGHLPYVNCSGLDDLKYRQYCDFCEEPMTRYGFGKDYAAFNCLGCGKKIETRDGGKTWENIKNN